MARSTRRARSAAMFAYHDAGFTTWDLADHYGPAEDFVGAFRRRFAARARRGPARRDPGLHEMGAASRPDDPARRRGRGRRVAAAHGCGPARPAAVPLVGLRATSAISTRCGTSPICATPARSAISALTNFDTERLAIIAEHGIRIVSNQVQYSLVDRRPDARMAAWCREHGVTLLTYGTLLGGLLSEKWLGRAEPGRAELTTASLRKYKQMIDVWGGWALFQELLAAVEARSPTSTASASPNVGDPLCARPPGGGRGHCRRPARGRRAHRRQCPRLRPRARRRGPRRARTGPRQIDAT